MEELRFGKTHRDPIKSTEATISPDHLFSANKQF